MPISVPRIVLAAKQHEIDELRHLAERAELSAVISHLIHCLQHERGASSIFLASGGLRFAETRRTLIAESEALANELHARFETQLSSTAFGNARIFSLMAWVLLGLEELPALRKQIDMQKLSAADAILAFSRLIAGLSSLIFEVADAAIDPEISRDLVALFNFIQGKEYAGQERAVGALCFASGTCEGADQQRILHLIEAQEKSFQGFSEFADPESLADWQAIEQDPANVALERLRRILGSNRPGGKLDANQIDPWFDVCSERIARIWALQRKLVRRLQDNCTQRIQLAERHLEDSTGLLKALMDNPPSSTGAIERFFDPDTPVDRAFRFETGEVIGPQLGHSIVSVLQAQSARLASMESELEKARRTLNERKVIERAKGVLMAHLSLSEEAAYRMLRKTAMDQNRLLIDIAEATLSFPAFAAAPKKP